MGALLGTPLPNWLALDYSRNGDDVMLLIDIITSMYQTEQADNTLLTCSARAANFLNPKRRVNGIGWVT